MAQTLTNIRIALRTDDEWNWLSSNPILNAGELAIVKTASNDVKIKVGNGIQTFKELQYLNDNLVATSLLSADEVSATSLSARSISQGYNTKSSPTSLATGILTEAEASFGVVHGIEAKIKQGDDYAFVFNGTNLPGISERYVSHGEGTFNINPLSGLSGVYIGDKRIDELLVTPQAIRNSNLFVKRFPEDDQEIYVESDCIHSIVFKGTNSSIDFYNDSSLSAGYIQFYGKNTGIDLMNGNISCGSGLNHIVFLHVSSESHPSMFWGLGEYLALISSTIPKKTSQLSNDSNFLTAHQDISQISQEVADKVKVGDYSGTLSAIQTLSVINIAADDYYDLVANDEVDQKAVYILSSDFINAYGQQIKNLSAPSDNGDATTKEYVDSKVQSISGVASSKTRVTFRTWKDEI